MGTWGGLQLASPWNLAPGLVTAGILLWLFWRSRRRGRPAVFPWRGLFIDNPPQSPRFPPPLWLVLLVLAVLALSTAASGPRWVRPAWQVQRLVVVLESGVEALSREIEGRRRFDQLVQALRRIVASDYAKGRFILIEAGLRPRASDRWLTAGEFREALRRVEPTEAPTDWRAALDRAEIRAARQDATLVIAAGTPEQHYQRWRAETGLPERPRVFVRAGRAAPNVGIESIAVFQSPFACTTETVEVHVRVRAFDHSQVRRVRLALDDQPFGEGRVETSISQFQARTLVLPGLPRAGVLSVRLEPRDDQPADDVARAVIPQPRRLRVA
ncbi:MAG TPA: hypothetical protein EYP56_00930, partial [Planctomycetaceae bacterium]|nr:hypothetical protein [Planctomycetaceae bacterium]